MAGSRKSNLTDLVAERLAPLLPGHSHILIGLSGGMDSVVLLHLLSILAPRFEWQLSALHVHHGISHNADAWANSCTELCTRHGIPLHIDHVDIAPLRDEHGIEAAARKLRHAAFARHDCDFVALAHHADDQAETLLLQLLRGAGVKGVAAMPALSLSKQSALKPASTHGHAIVRPLLDIVRVDLLDYAPKTGGRIDYVLVWLGRKKNTDSPDLRAVYAQLDKAFKKVFVSEHGLAELYQYDQPHR